jgi:hypothetical protein
MLARKQSSFFSDEMKTTMTTLFPCQRLYLDKSMLGNGLGQSGP